MQHLSLQGICKTYISFVSPTFVNLLQNIHNQVNCDRDLESVHRSSCPLKTSTLYRLWLVEGGYRQRLFYLLSY